MKVLAVGVHILLNELSCVLTPSFIPVSRYDNEYGYSCRVVDLISYMATKD